MLSLNQVNTADQGHLAIRAVPGIQANYQFLSIPDLLTAYGLSEYLWQYGIVVSQIADMVKLFRIDTVNSIP